MEPYRFARDVGVYSITFTVVEWLPVFIDQGSCQILLDSFEFCIKHKQLGVNAYVIMPTHLRAIVFDREFDVERLKHTLDDLRKFTGRKLLDYAGGHLPECFGDVFRSHAGEDHQRRFWQATQHPVGIFSAGFWKQKFDYLHQNPCRKGLVVRPEDWRFSSALYWSTRDLVDLPVSEVEWE